MGSEDPSASRNYAVTADGNLWRLSETQLDTFGSAADFGDGIVTASSGWQHDCAVKTSGSVWCEGQGYLGDGMDAYSTPQPPVPVSLPLAAVDVAAANGLTCATLSDGSVWCWGGAQLFGGVPFLSPAAWGLIDVRAVVAGAFHFCALVNDGSVSCWGDNREGQTGFEPAGGGDWETPHRVVALGNDVTQIAAGDAHTCARKYDSTIWCWGASQYGQAGTNRTANPAPIQMMGCE